MNELDKAIDVIMNHKSKTKAAAQASADASCSREGFNYVDVVGKGCEGWLNLFFGDYCVALVNNLAIAAEIRKTTPKRRP